MATAGKTTADVVAFEAIGRIPAPGDNVAIATGRLQAGTRFSLGNEIHTLKSSLLEGQRFAIEPIKKGRDLLSWALPFGRALRLIEPGEYLCNAGILEALNLRRLDFELPEAANFEDHAERFVLDQASFVPGLQVEPVADPATFDGFARPGGRGVGTRNDIVILGTSSLTAGFARALERRMNSESMQHGNIGRIVAVTHTEGGAAKPNNLELVLRTLAGFMAHPNVGAVLALDYGSEAVNNRLLEDYMRAHGHPLDHVLHRFYSIDRNFDSALGACAGILGDWLAPVGAMQRSSQPLSELRIALQCGGSDAFSGVSGNPLAGWVAREVIRHGGAAGLAETDELIGAESYMLANVRDFATAEKFLQKIGIFKERVGWHGHSAEGNPTGGNKFRGLYNITLKSIGAARKKDPDVRLDSVIDYAEKMSAPGFYFMDSPGNDLESIAGQVAAGCNMIFFITGNGSITNFPFVPTIKIVTTTGRWNLLSRDMDVNAGRYQDGTSMEALGRETFDYMLEIASGRLSVGEIAGHAQVSIWRDWNQTDASHLQEIRIRPRPGGKPIAVEAVKPLTASFQALPAKSGFAADQVGLIVPTSLCAGQIAKNIAERLNAGTLTAGRGVSRFVALPHTEGCGVSGGENQDHLTRTMAGHLQHPFVRQALLLEHGCEMTHNDLMRRELMVNGVDAEQFGYASIQLDGGIEKVSARVEAWFDTALEPCPALQRQNVDLSQLPISMLSFGAVPDPVAEALARLTASIASGGGTVVIPANASLLESIPFLHVLGWERAPAASLDYGQFARNKGVHVMAAPTRHAVETLTGLGGTGVQLMLAHVEQTPLQGHPMIPLIQIASRGLAARHFAADVDVLLDPASDGAQAILEKIIARVCAAASAECQTRAHSEGNLDFQLTRGLLGVSL
jgi:altronate dehydratase